MAKLNCWEYKNCGREPGGKNVQQLGICPATQFEKLNGIHDGKNGGRACWIVSETLCKGEIQGSWGKKYKQCMECPFYKSVREQEAGKFRLSATLMQFLK